MQTSLRVGLLALVVSGCAGGSSSAPPAAAPQARPAPIAAPSFRVEVSGQGPAMILIPGLASSGETWTTTVEHVRDRYTCHVLTLPGFAGVPPIQGPLLPAMTAELARYVAAHELARPVMVGHSLGGALALAVAAEPPDLAGPLVIVDSLPFFGGAVLGAASAEAARPALEQIRGGLAARTPEQYDAATRSGAATRSLVTSLADQQRVAAWALASDRATLEGALIEVLGTDLRPKLPRVTAPALVIGAWIGLADRPGPQIDRGAVVRWFHDQYATLPNMHFAMSDTARHFVMLDDLPWFTAELDRFLADPRAAVRDRGFPASP
jgi:pimeloyl-ACP methyl ester carboxylesterase